MVNRLAGGKLGSIAVFTMLLAGGTMPHVTAALAQDYKAGDGASKAGNLFAQIRLRGTRGDVNAQEAGDPFNDGPLPDENQPQVTDGQASTDAAAANQTTDAQAKVIAAPVVVSSEPQGRVLPVTPEPPVLDPINTATPDPRGNLRASPVEAGERRREKEDPFMPPGFRVGTWQVFARLEEAIGYSTNNIFDAGGQPGAFSQTDASLLMRSDWARHEAQIEATGSLVRALSDGEDTIPAAGVNGQLRLDLVDGYTATLRGNYDYTTEPLTSTSLVSGATQRPDVNGYGGSVEIARTGGYLDFSLRGSADRETYGSATLSDGSTFSQNDRNNTLYQLTGRLAFGPTPSLKPFVQGGIGKRVYDESVDRNGEDRSGTLVDLRAGLQVDLHEKLTGEMAVGYSWQDFNAGTIQTLDGITVNGTLNWSPERDTLVRLTAQTSFGGSTTAGDNGLLSYYFQTEAERRVRDNLAFNASASYQQSIYDTAGGSDRDYKVGVGAEYWVSRFVSLTANLDYERYDSMTPGNSWDATSVRIGVALQR